MVSTLRLSHPVLLEPIVNLKVTVPDENMGDVIGDLNSRRGHIMGMEGRSGAQVVTSMVPLAQMFGRSLLAISERARASSSGSVAIM